MEYYMHIAYFEVEGVWQFKPPPSSTSSPPPSIKTIPNTRKKQAHKLSVYGSIFYLPL